jgi:Tfp pilus assembly protein PilO
MNALRWHLNQWVRRLGATGLAGLALLAIALLLQVTQVGSLQQSITVQRARLTALRLTADTHDITPTPVQFNPLALLPPASEASQLIGELQQLAQAEGLELPRGQYSVSPLVGTSLRRWQLVLPVEATYPTLYAFIAAALERQPNLTLDELKLKRDRIETGDLQAELRMSLFVEAAP